MTNTNRPANPRYHVQTRSGAVWDWHCGSNDITSARNSKADARRTGYSARILDTRTNTVIK